MNKIKLEAEGTTQPAVRHEQEIRTVRKILLTFIQKKRTTYKRVENLADLVVQNDLVEQYQYEKWKAESDHHSISDTLIYFKNKIEKDFRARNVLMTWLGMHEQSVKEDIFNDEQEFAIQEIYKREKWKVKDEHARDDYRMLGFRAGQEDGPDCVFQVLSNMDIIREKNPHALREEIITFMKNHKPNKEILRIIDPSIPVENDTEWRLYCKRFQRRRHADASVLLAASSYCDVNIHIIYRSQENKSIPQEYIIYSSAINFTKNVYLGHLAGQEYVSLLPDIGSEFYDGLEIDRRTMRTVIERQATEIQTLTKELKLREDELDHLHMLQGSSESSNEITNERTRILREEIKSLKTELRSIEKEKERKEEEHIIEKKTLITKLENEQAKQKEIKEDHDKRIEVIGDRFKSTLDKLRAEFTKALDEAKAVKQTSRKGIDEDERNYSAAEQSAQVDINRRINVLPVNRKTKTKFPSTGSKQSRYSTINDRHSSLN